MENQAESDAKDSDKKMFLEKKHSIFKHLVFSLNDESFAIPLHSVKELIGVPNITPVPDSPKFFKGIFNLRGKVISVIDLRKKMGLEEVAFKKLKTSIVIADVHGLTIGAIVDEVLEVVGYREDEIDREISISSSVGEDLITGVAKKGDEKLAILLDISKILNTNELGLLKANNSH